MVDAGQAAKKSQLVIRNLHTPIFDLKPRLRRARFGGVGSVVDAGEAAKKSPLSLAEPSRVPPFKTDMPAHRSLFFCVITLKPRVMHKVHKP